MNLPKQSSRELCVGILSIGLPGGKPIILEATSGHPPYQFEGSTTLKGRGPIPGCSFAQVPFYGVLTRRIYMPKVRGVEGSFYPITPHKVVLKGTNLERSDMGIHFDANVPGSAGCIVLRQQNQWDVFRQLMARFEKEGIECLMLDVKYS